MRLSTRMKRFVISVVLGLSLFAAASAPAFAQHHDRQNRNGINRRSSVLGIIFGRNNRHRQYDRYDRGRYNGRYDDYRLSDRHGRGRHYDRHRRGGYNSRW